MTMTNQFTNLTLFKSLCICLTIILVLSCGSNEKHIGTYVSEIGGEKNATQQTLELKEKGEGVWKSLDDEVAFNWNIKKKELRLHFKPSGIVAGQIQGDKIIIQLPGAVSREFIKEKTVMRNE